MLKQPSPPPSPPSSPRPSPSSSKTERTDIIKYVPLYRALVKGELKSVITILDKDPKALYARISTKKETPIHIAVSHGHVELVEKLLKRFNTAVWPFTRDDYRDTVLHAAVRGGNEKMAKALVDKAKGINSVTLTNDEEHTPLTLAAIYNNKKVLELLRSFHDEKVYHCLGVRLDERRNMFMFREFIKSENYDLALKHWERQQHHSILIDDNLNQLAKMVSAFSIENQVGYFKSWMYRFIDVQDNVQSVSTSHNTSDVENQHEAGQPVMSSRENPPEDSTMLRFVKELISNVAKTIGIEDIRDKKKKIIQARELLSKMCSPIWTFDSKYVEVYFEAIKVGIKCGNVGFVEEVLRSNPSLLWGDKKSGTIFHVAVACRQEKIWNLIYGLTTEQRNKICGTLVKSNSMLHIAAYPLVVPDEALEKQGAEARRTKGEQESEKISPEEALKTQRDEQQLQKMVQDEQQLWKIFSKAPGAAMKVQRELQWYKEVERTVPSSYKFLANQNGETPLDLFSKRHSKLVREGERWMRDTATSYTIVATLIVTVMFAAAFTLPGGIDENSGSPKLLWRKSFLVFLISDAFSLFSSVTAVLMFLSILTSHFEEKDFLRALPKRLIIGRVALFFSIAAMMVAFGSTLVIVLGDRITWAVVLVTVTLPASIPVTLFAFLQFPLLLDTFKFTYGRDIFNRKTKCSFFNNPNDYVPKKKGADSSDL